MRVAIIAKGVTPHWFGGYTFVTSILEAIEPNLGGHSFAIYDQDNLRSIERNSDKVWTYAVRKAARRIGDAVGAGPLLSGAAELSRQVRQNSLTGFEQTSAWDRHFRELGIDLVWFPYPGEGVASIPYITTVWDLHHRRYPYFPEFSHAGWTWEARERHYRRILLRASKVITGTEVGKSDIVRFYGVAPENVVVIPLPTRKSPEQLDEAAPPEVRQKYRLNGDFLFYPAQFWQHKNHVNLLLALDLLKRNADVDINLVLAGGDQGNLSYVREIATLLGLSAKVRFLGFIPESEIRELYREAVALVYPSFGCPDNLPPLEAFALGCAVIASRIPGSAEQLGEAALLFNPTDPADIADAILRAIRDPELRLRLIERGKRVASDRTPQSYVAQICRVLDEFAPFRRCWR